MSKEVSELRTDKVIPFAWSDLGDQKSRDLFARDRIGHCCYPDERQNVSKFLQSFSKYVTKRFWVRTFWLALALFTSAVNKTYKHGCRQIFQRRESLSWRILIGWVFVQSFWNPTVSVILQRPFFIFKADSFVIWRICEINTNQPYSTRCWWKMTFCCRFIVIIFPGSPRNQPAPFNLPEWR